MKITRKNNPKAWAIIKKVLPNYRKKSAVLYVGKDVMLSGRFWDSGSLTEWFVGDPKNILHTIKQRQDFPFEALDKIIDLTNGDAAVSTGYFCGKAATAAIYIEKDPDEVVENKIAGLQEMVEDYVVRNRKTEIENKIAGLQAELAAL